MPQVVSSGFPVCPKSTLWLAFVSALQTDPVLNSRVRLWQVWDGSEDAQRAPDADDLPWLRLDLMGGISGWLDESSHQYALNIRVTIGLPGTRVTDLFDFWHAIHTALFTGNTVLNALIPLGLYQKTITDMTVAPRPFGGDEGVEATGVITLKARLDS